jgi:hypothetical protein
MACEESRQMVKWWEGRGIKMFAWVVQANGEGPLSLERVKFGDDGNIISPAYERVEEYIKPVFRVPAIMVRTP